MIPVSEIIGEGLFYLRPVCKEDREKIYYWRNSPDVAKYMYTDHHITVEEHNRWFVSILKDKTKKYWIIIYDKEEVGLANITDIDEKNKRCFYASYIASKNLRGRGIGSIAEYYILQHLFDHLGFHKICAEVFSFNKAGINVHKCMGFQVEGVYRQHRIKNGQYADVAVLAMLKSEWDKKKPEIEKRLKAKRMEI